MIDTTVTRHAAWNICRRCASLEKFCGRTCFRCWYDDPRNWVGPGTQLQQYHTNISSESPCPSSVELGNLGSEVSVRRCEYRWSVGFWGAREQPLWLWGPCLVTGMHGVRSCMMIAQVIIINQLLVEYSTASAEDKQVICISHCAVSECIFFNMSHPKWSLSVSLARIYLVSLMPRSSAKSIEGNFRYSTAAL
jgi:hypothetical protein